MYLSKGGDRGNDSGGVDKGESMLLSTEMKSCERERGWGTLSSMPGHNKFVSCCKKISDLLESRFKNKKS